MDRSETSRTSKRFYREREWCVRVGVYFFLSCVTHEQSLLFVVLSSESCIVLQDMKEKKIPGNFETYHYLFAIYKQKKSLPKMHLLFLEAQQQKVRAICTHNALTLSHSLKSLS